MIKFSSNIGEYQNLTCSLYAAYQKAAEEGDETQAAILARQYRDILLQQTDCYALTDRVVSDEWKEYRQALRDITQQEGFPLNVTFPNQPTK